ncbi:hypothetical protein FQA39_LY04998 [Lamprigera yunnana]|nr:hypothetical protein FQA39_LY04998 [Lamprigera yunnana]
MHTRILSFFSLLSTAFVHLPIENTDILLKLQKLASIYQQKCLNNTNPAELQELLSSIATNDDCFNAPTSSEVNVRNICLTSGSKALGCIKRYSKLIKACLDEDEKYLPDFLVDAQQRVLNKFCKDDYVEKFTKVFHSICKTPTETLMPNAIFSKCIPNLTIFESIEKGEFSLKKDVLCSVTRTIQECVIKGLTVNCEIPKEDVELVSSLYTEQLKECGGKSNGNIITLSTLSLFLIVIKHVF